MNELEYLKYIQDMILTNEPRMRVSNKLGNRISELEGKKSKSTPRVEPDAPKSS